MHGAEARHAPTARKCSRNFAPADSLATHSSIPGFFHCLSFAFHCLSPTFHCPFLYLPRLSFTFHCPFLGNSQQYSRVFSDGGSPPPLFDLVVCNPPYGPATAFYPATALPLSFHCPSTEYNHCLCLTFPRPFTDILTAARYYPRPSPRHQKHAELNWQRQVRHRLSAALSLCFCCPFTVFSLYFHCSLTGSLPSFRFLFAALSLWPAR